MTGSTTPLFRDDFYLSTSEAVVTAVHEDGGIELDQTCFYATSGGQPGDTGFLERADGSRIALGLGIGKWFMLQTLYAAWSSDPKLVTVTTNNLDHPRALQLYQMFGFSPVSTEEGSVTPLSETELRELARLI